MVKNLLLLLCFAFAINVAAQNTVGLLSYDPAKAFDGYNLIYPHNQPNVYLLNMCGEIVHTWEDDADFRPGNTAYITADGFLIKTKRPSAVAGNPIWAGGGGGIVEKRSWTNDLIWSFEQNDENARLHHDIAPLDNGNVLMISWELKTEEEALQAGRDTATTAQDKLWPDYILELDGTTGNVVWEWHVWDHLVQDFDAAKDNFGVVGDHPELIDINYETSNGHPDWMHTNAIDYNEELKQILISVPTFSEVWVIDHTTTTAQASGHTGGQAGRGGDLLYRWGNPLTYDQGTVADQKLFYPHDIQWVDDFIEPGSSVHYGKIAAFNNRVGTDYSTANIFASPWDMYSWSYTYAGNSYAPSDFDVTLVHPVDSQALYSTGLSSVQLLPNGNTLICSGRFGYSFEVSPDDEIVWEYKTPIIAGAPATQGDTLQINNNLTFRMKRIPADYSGFSGQDLTQTFGYIELNPNVNFCDEILPVAEPKDQYQLTVYPNPANKMVTIEWEGGVYDDFEIFDITGKLIMQYECTGGRKYLDVSDWHPGMYFIQINKSDIQKMIIQR